MMRDLSNLFGQSPFEPLVEHARKVHECVKLIRPIADAIVAGDTAAMRSLQHEMSLSEYEADQIKDKARQTLPSRYFLPVNRDDVANFLRQMDRIADDAEDFAVAATLRTLVFPPSLREEFLALVDKVVQVSEQLLDVAEHLAELQKEAFTGSGAQDVLKKIEQVCYMEWESDKLSRKLARHYYGIDDIDPITVIILEKLSTCLRGIADHAENVGKNLRLMIIRK
jgi:predicted phosphate transport protein (TIGR00153 family)